MAQTGSHIHMTEVELETVQERILELLSNDESVQSAVMWEVHQRSSGEIEPLGSMTAEQEEFTCMCSLLVYDRILKSVIK